MPMPDALDELLSEQVAYYRERAPDYEANTPLPHEEASHRQLLEALRAFAPRGRVLELACGSGYWTGELAEHASELTALDAAPEMLALASARLPDRRIRFVQADIFDWSPDRRYDVVFFSAWLSHVPPQRFAQFWALVDACLADDGRVFVIDELPAAATEEKTLPDAVAPAVERPLRGGAHGRVVKVFYDPGELRDRLAGLGWRVEVATVGWRFFYATGAKRALPQRPSLS